MRYAVGQLLAVPSNEALGPFSGRYGVLLPRWLDFRQRGKSYIAAKLSSFFWCVPNTRFSALVLELIGSLKETLLKGIVVHPPCDCAPVSVFVRALFPLLRLVQDILAGEIGHGDDGGCVAGVDGPFSFFYSRIFPIFVDPRKTRVVYSSEC